MAARAWNDASSAMRDACAAALLGLDDLADLALASHTP
jgi:hypothetical protein